MIDPTLLEILACPACKTAVALDGERLVCGSCGRRYPIREGIPVMLLEEAEQIKGQTSKIKMTNQNFNI